MRELFSMWRNTRMVVMVGICAAAYVAVLLPFKGFVLIPGLTEVRPGAAIPVVLSFILGPAAAWGSGIGNVVADALGGMLGPGSLFGFLGNALYGFIPYALWRAFMGRRDPVRSGWRGWLVMIVILATNCLIIGSIIGLGTEILHLAPFATLGLILAVNNFIASAAISTILLTLLYGRVRTWGLLYYQILDEGGAAENSTGADDGPEFKPRKASMIAGIFLVMGSVILFATGFAVSGEALQAGHNAAIITGSLAGSFSVALKMLPGLLIVLLSLALL